MAGDSVRFLMATWKQVVFNFVHMCICTDEFRKSATQLLRVPTYFFLLPFDTLEPSKSCCGRQLGDKSKGLLWQAGLKTIFFKTSWKEIHPNCSHLQSFGVLFCQSFCQPSSVKQVWNLKFRNRTFSKNLATQLTWSPIFRKLKSYEYHNKNRMRSWFV